MRAFLESFSYAARGVSIALKEHNMRIHAVVTLFVVIMADYFKISRDDWCWVIGCIALVAALETTNTAIERACNLVDEIAGLGIDLRIRNIKDIAAGAVLIVSIASAVIGVLIFAPYVLKELT